MTHTSLETLLTYLDHRLDPAAHALVEEHIRACKDCRSLLNAAQLLLQQQENSAIATPRPALIRRAVAAFRHFQQRRGSPDEPRVSLLFDSWESTQIAGTRGQSEDRQLLFQAAEFDVDVQITFDAATKLHAIQGQLLSDHVSLATFEGIPVRLQGYDEEQNSRRTLIDELGRFSFFSLPSARYTLQIDLSDTTIRIEEFTLTPPNASDSAS